MHENPRSLRQQIPAKAFAKYDWLHWLADAFDLHEETISREIERRANEGLSMPACREGCDTCCRKMALGALHIEIMGISYWTSEILIGEQRATVKRQLEEHEERLECPFLVHKTCAVYPVRPLMCRGYYVLGDQCGEDECVEETRQDAFISIPLTARVEIGATLLRGMKLGGMHDCRTKAENGGVFALTKPFDEMNFKILAQTMSGFSEQDS